MTTYPTVDEVIATHALLVTKFGGSAGLRDRGVLQAAIARPQTGYYQDLIQEAAALWESLSQNHPFIDGNKRVEVTVTAAFLKVNGYRLEFDDLFPHPAIRERPDALLRVRGMVASAHGSHVKFILPNLPTATAQFP
ncbi:MAG: Death-on-curing protein [Bryobacterales bacterium]|nr:Death-on-curing protein [Bryobacterales bacterium]